jgi:hypothetical protein
MTFLTYAITVQENNTFSILPNYRHYLCYTLKRNQIGHT